MEALRNEKSCGYTYEEFAAITGDQPAELIDGEIYLMSGVNEPHQAIVGELHWQFKSFLRGKKCKVYFSPYDVRLSDEDERKIAILEPDLFVVCDPKKLKRWFCDGAPDLVVEVLSPSTRGRDKVVKVNLYQRHGVREYWMVDPEIKAAEVLVMDNGQQSYKVYSQNEKIKVSVLEDCEIDLSEVFAEVE